MRSVLRSCFALAIIGSAACSTPAGDPRVRIRFADLINVDVRDVPLLMAFDDLAADGYTIETVYLSSAGAMTDLLVRGEAEIAMTNNQTAWIAVSKGADLRTVGAFTAATSLLAAHAEIRSCGDLHGKRVGTPSTTGLSPVLFRTYLARRCPGVEPQVMLLPESGARAQALVAHRLDASLMPGEELLKLQEQSPSLHSLMTYAQEFPDVQVEGLHVRRDWAAQHPAAVRAFLRAQLLAYRRVKENPQLLYDESVRRLAIDAATARAIGASHLRMNIWDVNGQLTPENVQATIDFLVEANALPSGITAAQVADFSFLDAVLAEIGRIH